MFDETDDYDSEPGLLASMLRYRWSIVAFVIIATALTYAVSALQESRYTASAQVLLKDPRDPGLLGSSAEVRFLDPETYFPQQAALLTGTEVLEVAAGLLGTDVTAERLRAVADTSSDSELHTVRVTVTTESPERSAAYADAIVQAYSQVVAAEAEEEANRAVQAIEEQILALRDDAEEAAAAAAANPEDTVAASRARVLTERVIALESRAGDVAAEAAVRGGGVERIREASIPSTPSAPNPERDAALAGALALALGTLLAYWRAGADDRIRSAGDAAAVLEAPLLGEIPTFPSGGRHGHQLAAGPVAAEAFHFVLASVDYALADVGGATVLVTSAAPGDGKTVSAAQLALAACRDGRSALLIDGDVRARGLTRLLRSEEVAGLTDVVAGATSVSQAIRRYRIDDDTILPVMTSGTAGGGVVATMRSARLSSTLAEVRSQADVVVVDSPPLLAAVDSTLLANQVDGIVLVISPGTTRKQLHKMKTRLGFVTTPVLGYVYNKADREAAAYGYGYGLAHETSRLGRLRNLMAGRSSSNGAGKQRIGAGSTRDR